MTVRNRRNGKWRLGNPEWEAMKASRRSISHAAAVRESVEITQLQWRLMQKKGPAKIDLYAIIRKLNEKKIPFVLTGAHGIGGWTGRPRSTKDVDILVRSGRNHARAVKAMKELYPHLETRKLFGVTAFFVPGETESVIDVTYPHREDNLATLENPIWAEEKGLRYRIPDLEYALANKYGAMLALSRHHLKRGQDALDFAWMIKHSLDQGRRPIDLEKLAALGELVWPGGGGKEILRLVDEAKADQIPIVNPRGEN